MWNIGCLKNGELTKIPPKDVKANCSAKGIEKCKICGNLMDKDVENSDDHGCSKIRDLDNLKAYEKKSKCSSYPIRHKITLHNAERVG